jgi:23S rRNA (cytosine1962-C5)-methyltransferase
MELITPLHWKNYELLDCGDFEKLERFGDYITIRPEPQAVWPKKWSNDEWNQKAHIKFIPKNSNSGEWKKMKKMPDQWQISYGLPNNEDITFRLGLTSFKHVGIFPEQAANWDFIVQSLKAMKTPKPKVLNLFAYTGGASLAASAGGGEVTHVDSIKQVVTWANENMQLSNLTDIRWMVEDALKFVQREERRGNKYQGIILDPPAFGHGPKGEKWKLEDNIAEMMENVLKILDEKEHFLVLNAYSLGLSALVIENLCKDFSGKDLKIGELYLQAKSGVKLPLGVFGRSFRTK